MNNIKKYYRWIIFGIVVIVLLIILVLVGYNSKLRTQVGSLILERFIKNKTQDIKDEIVNVKIKAETGKIKAAEAEEIANEMEAAISDNKRKLEDRLKSQGLSAEEISNRFNKLSI